MKHETGQATAEYAVGALAAATIAGVLFDPGGVVSRALAGWIDHYLERALVISLPDLFRWPW